MSIFSTFNIGKLGVTAHQRAIQVTSNNIANVNTPGYSRQRPLFGSIAPTLLPDGFPTGGGVELVEVERVADQFLDSQLWRERQNMAFDEGKSTGLGRIESIMEELSGDGIGSSLSAFFGSLNDLATNPSDPTVRATVVEKAVSLTTLLNDTDSRLAQAAVDENQRVAQIAVEINQVAAEIANVNARIFQLEGAGDEAAALRDRRGSLMEELAEKVDFTSFERDDGQVAIFVGGGFLLVDSETSATLTTQVGASSNASFFDVYQNVDGSVAGPITSRITGGELGAAISLRDDRIPFYRAQLDEFAYSLAVRANTAHMAGRGTVDSTARRLFVDPTGTASAAGPDFVSISGAATRIAVNTDLVGNAFHLAAGQPTSGAAVEGDNRNALALAAIESTTSAMYQITSSPPDTVGGAASGVSRTLGQFYDSVLGGLGAERLTTQRRADSADLIVAELSERRGALSGVSIDEEVANLVRFERAYQASARVIQTANSLLMQLMEL